MALSLELELVQGKTLLVSWLNHSHHDAEWVHWKALRLLE